MKIVHAAEQLFAEHGYHGARLRQIAAAVGIQKASLFHYFTGKEGLYRTVLEESLADIGSALERAACRPAPFRDRLRGLVSAYVDMMAERPAHTRMLLRQCLEGTPVATSPWAPRAPSFVLVVEFIRDGQRAHAFRPLDDPTPLILSIVATAAFFFTAVPQIAPGWPAEHTEREAFATAVKRYITEMAERMLLVPDDVPRRGAEETPHGLQAH